MRSYTENINDLIASKGSSTFSAITPMGRQHENDREATAADLKWLADPAEEPEPFGGGWDEDGLEYIQCCIHLSKWKPVDV